METLSLLRLKPLFAPIFSYGGYSMLLRSNAIKLCSGLNQS